MMKLVFVFHLFSGFTGTIILANMPLLIGDSNYCSVISNSGVQTANCSCVRWTEIPSNLSETLEIVIIPINSSTEWCSCVTMKHLLRKRRVTVTNLNCSLSDVESLFCNSVTETISNRSLDYDLREKVKCSSVIEVLIPLVIVTLIVFVSLVFMTYKSARRYFSTIPDFNPDEESPM